MSKTVLIAGGAGYIGSHVNFYLQNQGYETIIVDNLSEGYREYLKGDFNYEADLGDIKTLDNIFSKHQIDCVMHFAANIVVGESVNNPAKYYRNNVFNMINLLEVMKDHKVNNIVFSSTAAVFGNPETSPITEQACKQPINPYGKSKYMCEQILEDYDTAFGIKSVALRYFNACGRAAGTDLYERHNPETHLIPIIFQVVEGKREFLSIFGSDYETEDGTCVRDYIHVLDLAQAHEKAACFLDEHHKSDRFNLGNGHGYSVKEIKEAVEKAMKVTIPCKFESRRAGDSATLVASSEKARTILNWQPKFDSIEKIIDTLK